MVTSFSKFYGEIWVGFCLNIRKRFLVEATKIENTPCSFKAALSEANVKTNIMATTQ